MRFDISVIEENIGYLLWGRTPSGQVGGLLLTILMSLGSGILALTLGVTLGVVAFRTPRWIRQILFFIADLIRGIPLLFVIFWLFILIPAVFKGGVPGAITVILALAWFSSASVMYSTFAGLSALPQGQEDAGIASGFSHLQILLFILLPQAFRNLLPSYVGLFVSLIKDTSLAFIVNVPDLTYVANQVNSRTQIHPLQIYCFMGVVYFCLNSIISMIANRIGRKKKSEHRNPVCIHAYS